MQQRTKSLLQAAGAAGAGALAGKGTVMMTGMSAVGMVGQGAGVGAAAGPLGVVAGAIVGLAGYGLIRALRDD